jgi:ribulose-phosphate 3-epimerase
MLGVAPSVLAADFARLGEQVDAVIGAGARLIHVDVMDGHFVPPITMGPLVVEALRGREAVLDVHLMIERPERQIEQFARAGADVIHVHAEATPHVNYALAHVRETGCRAGLAVNPSTPPAVFGEVSDLVDVALCMTVNPGWGGQPFIEASLEKIRRLRALLPDHVPIEVDGGIDRETIGRCARAGAEIFVAGSAVFGAADPAAAVADLSAALDGQREEASAR